VRFFMRTRLDSKSKIGRYRGPLLQCHGDCDEIEPFACGKALYDASARENKRFVAVPGGTHPEPPSEDYFAAVVEFLGSLPPLPSAGE
jgi:hypothetical protein